MSGPAPAPPLPPTTDAPPALAECVAECLHKDPAQRPRAEEIASRLEAFLAGPESEVAAACPYPGLLPYTEQGADSFFGREAEIEAFLEALRALSRGQILQGLAASAPRVLDRLIESRLLAVHTAEDLGEGSVELAHESLVHSWPRLAGWIEMRRVEPAFHREEIDAEWRLNRLNLVVAAVLIGFTFVNSLITDKHSEVFRTFSGTFSNLVGAGLFLAYGLAVRALLRRGIYRRYVKYVTMGTAVTILTLVIGGYCFQHGWVHSVRTCTLTVYFVLIAISGTYHRPLLSLLTGIAAAVAYTSLFLVAVLHGKARISRMETFTEDAVSFDVLFVYAAMLVLSGGVVAYVARRHRQMLQQAVEAETRVRIVDIRHRPER